MPDDDAAELFRDAIKDVKPLRARTAPKSPPRPKARAKFARAERDAVLRESLDPSLNPLLSDPALVETGEEISFRRPGVPETTLRRLRRGHFAVAEELDLHGLTAPQARVALRDFIADQSRRGARCVRVIHGKGLRSGPRGPVLKNVVNIWLRRCDAVVAFGSARPTEGGSGAVYVLLRD